MLPVVCQVYCFPSILMLAKFQKGLMDFFFLFYVYPTQRHTKPKSMRSRHVLGLAVLSLVRRVKESPLSRQSRSFHHSFKISICVGTCAVIFYSPETYLVSGSQEALLSD